MTEKKWWGPPPNYERHVHIAFDKGGALQPGLVLVTNQTEKPERVIPKEQGA
jgi:hypothetical protein